MRIGTFQRLRIKSGGRNRETEHAPKFVRSLDNLRSLTRPLFPSNCYCPIDLIGITLEVKKLPHTEREKERKNQAVFQVKGLTEFARRFSLRAQITNASQNFPLSWVLLTGIFFREVRKTKHSRELPALASIDISPILRVTDWILFSRFEIMRDFFKALPGHFFHSGFLKDNLRAR